MFFFSVDNPTLFCLNISMLTQRDLESIEELIDEKLDEKLKILPSKNEFFTKMGELMKELEALRQETTVLPEQVADLKDRVENLENIHPKGKHPQFAV